MKYSISAILLFISIVANAQSGRPVPIPGTKYSLVPPEGFEAATSFSGFQDKATGSSIMISEIPAPYQQMADGFTAEALKSRGMTLVSKDVIDFNKARATYFKVTQQANGVTYLKDILVFGNEQHTVLVNGIYPEASKQQEGKMREALLS